MFTVPVFLAILQSPGVAEVIRPFELAQDAMAQCHAWASQATDLRQTPSPGYPFCAVFGKGRHRVRVERHTLELRDPEDDPETEPDDLSPLLGELRSLTRGPVRVLATKESN